MFDVHAIQQHLRRFGIDVGEAKSRFGADGEDPSVYLRDPEGNTIELKGPSRSGPA